MLLMMLLQCVTNSEGETEDKVGCTTSLIKVWS